MGTESTLLKKLDSTGTILRAYGKGWPQLTYEKREWGEENAKLRL